MAEEGKDVLAGGDDNVTDLAGRRSLADRAADGENGHDEQTEEELFPLGSIEGDPKTTLKNLIKSGKPIEYTVSMRSAEVPLRGGLPDPDAFHRIFVNSVLEKVETVALREENKVVGWKVRAVLRPVFVQQEDAQLDGAAASGS